MNGDTLFLKWEKISSIEGLLQHHTCIAGLLTDETALYILPGKDVTQYVRTFAALAKKYQRKFFWFPAIFSG